MKPTADEIAAARNVLDRLLKETDLNSFDTRRAKDGIRVLEDAFWRLVDCGLSTDTTFADLERLPKTGSE